MKKTIALFTITIILLSSTFSYGAEYKDIKSSNWAYDAVNTMSEKTVISGYPDGSFRPNNTVTYGEFIKMALIAATGEDVGNAETGSTATASASGNWAANYYDKSVELGYFTKADITKDDLNDKITRAHMALIISSILGDVKIDNYDEIQKGITDITYKTAYEYDITKAYATGILTGYTDKTFQPEKTLTRAEAAVVIYRLVDESKRVLPGSSEKEDKKVEMSTAGGYKFEATVVPATLGDQYGIAKVIITPQGYVAMYSTTAYDKISLIIDNKMVNGFGNANGTSYWIIDGYYVYFATPEKDGVNVKGKHPSILVDGVNNIVITMTDVTL